MIGIMTKDLFQTLYIRKYRAGILSYYTVMALNILLTKNIYGLLFPALIWIPFLITPSLQQVASERDDISNYDKILLTMPVTKGDVVAAKYGLGILFSLFNAALLLVGILLHGFLFKSVTFTQGFYLIFSSFLLSLLSLSINYLSYAFLGSKGVLVSAGMIVVVLAGYYWNPAFLHVEKIITSILSINPLALCAAGAAIAAIALWLSYLCACLHYTRKEIR